MHILPYGDVKEATLSEALQVRRRADKLKDWIATMVVALVMAGLCAAVVEVLVLLVGKIVGDPNWYRPWVDKQFGMVVTWVENLPFVGEFASAASKIPNLLPQESPFRDLLALLVFFSIPCLVPAKRVGPTLIARYDVEALRVAPPSELACRWAGLRGDEQKRVWAELREWCFTGVGKGRSPPLRPWVMPHVEERFSIAFLTGVDGLGKSHMAEAFSREIDGSNRLAAAPNGRARLFIRLQTKLNDCLWWRARQTDDPWDSGYLVEDPVARLRLKTFRPRRATFLVADGLSAPSLTQCIDDLTAQRTEFHHPVRLLVVDSVVPSALELRSKDERQRWTSSRNDLGPVTILHMSDVRFGAEEFRSLREAHEVAGTDEK